MATTSDAPLRPTPAMVVAGRTLAEPRLSPDGTAVVVHVRDGGGPRLVRIDLGAGPVVAVGPEVTIAFDPPVVGVHPSGGGSWEWMPDGRAIAYVSTVGLALVSRDGGPGHVLVRSRESVSFVSPTPSPDGTGIAFVIDTGEAQSVAVVSVETGELRVVAEGDPSVFRMDPSWGRNGTLTWHEWRAPFMPWDESNVMELDPHGTSIARVVSHGGLRSQPRRSPDGERLGMIGDATGWANVTVDDRAVVGAGTGESYEHGTPSWGPGQRCWCWSPDSTHVAFDRNEGGFARLCVANVETGVVAELGKAWHLGLSWSTTSGGASRIAAIRTGGVTPTQLVVYDLGPNDLAAGAVVKPTRTTVARGPVGGWEQCALPEPEIVSWAASDGVTVHGRIYAPAKAHGGLLVSCHGGPTDQNTVTFQPRFAYWLSEGWTILVPDYRGSTGWGRDYQRAMNGRWGELDVADSAEGARSMVASRGLDGGRVVAIGGSAGGFCALHLLLRHPDVFVAGVALYPVTDLAELDRTTHRFERSYSSTLVGPPELYRERSPLTGAGMLRRPLLILHGDADIVVNVEQSRAFALAARREGAQVELVVFEGEGHGWKRPQSTVDELHHIDAFLYRHAGAPEE